MNCKLERLVRLKRCETCDRCTARGNQCELGFKTRHVIYTDMLIPCEPCWKPLTIPDYLTLRDFRQANRD